MNYYTIKTKDMVSFPVVPVGNKLSLSETKRIIEHITTVNNQIELLCLCNVEIDNNMFLSIIQALMHNNSKVCFLVLENVPFEHQKLLMLINSLNSDKNTLKAIKLVDCSGVYIDNQTILSDYFNQLEMSSKYLTKMQLFETKEGYGKRTLTVISNVLPSHI